MFQKVDVFAWDAGMPLTRTHYSWKGATRTNLGSRTTYYKTKEQLISDVKDGTLPKKSLEDMKRTLVPYAILSVYYYTKYWLLTACFVVYHQHQDSSYSHYVCSIRIVPKLQIVILTKITNFWEYPQQNQLDTKPAISDWSIDSGCYRHSSNEYKKSQYFFHIFTVLY